MLRSMIITSNTGLSDHPGFDHCMISAFSVCHEFMRTALFSLTDQSVISSQPTLLPAPGVVAAQLTLVLQWMI